MRAANLGLMRVLWPLLGTAAVLAAQEPAIPNDLEKLARSVDAAHRPDGTTRQFRGFAAALEMKQTARDKERGEATLRVRYLRWLPPGRKREIPLIRYRVVDSATPIERGRDLNGYWQIVDGKPKDLETRDTTADLANVRRDLNLARQLLRFLDPGAVLRGLRDPTPVSDEEVVLGRTAPVPCTVVAGALESFPRLWEPGADTPVRLKVFIAHSTNHLFAVEIWPLDEHGVPDRERGEFVKLDDLRMQSGVKLPMRLSLYRSGADGRRIKQMEVSFLSVELDPPLAPADFDRSTRGG
ncbi:MAG: hypothetical protein Fur0037_02820 [Planctomycetota bacterium]